MHAYNRTEADQTDSIAVVATAQQWRDVISDIIDMEPEDSSPATLKLFELLDELGLV